MSPRALLVLAGLVAFALAGLWLTHEDPGRAAAEPGERFMPGLLERVNEVTAITVRRGGAEVVAELRRGPDSDWRVANRWDYPADRANIRALLIALAEARIEEEGTADPERWGRLGVAAIDHAEASGMEVTLGGAGDEMRVIVGQSGPAGEGNYVRRADAGRVWRLDLQIPRRLRAADWLAADLIDIEVDAVAAVDIEPAEGEPVKVRADKGESHGFRLLDVPPGTPLLTPSIGRSIARVVTELRLKDVWPRAEVGALEPVASARFTTRDGLIVTLDTHTLPEYDGIEVATLRAATTDEADGAAAERAAELSGRWSEWVYRLPDHKFINASHHFDRVVDPDTIAP